MVLLSAGFDKDTALESKAIRVGCLICLIVTMIICYSYGGSPTRADPDGKCRNLDRYTGSKFVYSAPFMEKRCKRRI